MTHLLPAQDGRCPLESIWTPADDVPKTAHAMYSLKAAMKWDEDVSLYLILNLFDQTSYLDFKYMLF